LAKGTVTVFWSVSDQVKADPAFTKVRIYSSGTEQTGYGLVAELDSKTGEDYVTTYTDQTGDSLFFYIVRYYDPISNSQTGIITAFQELTPREVRLITQLKTFVPAVMAQTTTDNDLRQVLLLALNSFNIYPPETGFDVMTFPRSYEAPWLQLSQITFLGYRYLGIAIRDFNYSDNGQSLTVDRGSKIDNIMSKLLADYNATIKLVKLNFVPGPGVVGTNMLPFPNLRGQLNVLDIFNSIG